LALTELRGGTESLGTALVTVTRQVESPETASLAVTGQAKDSKKMASLAMKGQAEVSEMASLAMTERVQERALPQEEL